MGTIQEAYVETIEGEAERVNLHLLVKVEDGQFSIVTINGPRANLADYVQRFLARDSRKGSVAFSGIFDWRDRMAEIATPIDLKDLGVG
jgi:hypothetical protein